MLTHPAPRASADATTVRARGGFTAIELVVVIGIMLLLSGMALPGVLKSLRRGSVNSAANDVSTCWRQARQLAMTRSIPDAVGVAPKHYGIALVQQGGAQPYVALIYDNEDTGAVAGNLDKAILRRDPTNFSTSDTANPPVARYRFNRNVRLATAQAPAAAPAIADTVVVVYAQYRTGSPIAPSEVAASRGPVAAPISLGLAGNPDLNIPASPLMAALQLETVDYSDAPRRGFGLAVTLYPVGVVGTKEL